MDPWHLIANDHANIVSLCSDILRAMPGASATSRERLFDELEGELRRHLEAEEDSLYEALEDHPRTKRLINELEDEHDKIAGRLSRLAHALDKGRREWSQEFEDFSYLLDRHFHREERELLPLAREILDAGQIQKLRHDFAEEKIEELRKARHGLWGGVPTGMLVGALVGAAAGAVVFTAWRKGTLGDLMVRPPVRRYLSKLPVVNRFADYLGLGTRAMSGHELDVLQDIAERTRCPVQDVSARLRLPIGRTYAIVATLERQGFVRSGYEQEGGRERMMAAITPRGHEAMRG
jgi:hemerythrin-like domain-containing protein/DNA-binding MarR family transcriptional regulator